MLKQSIKLPKTIAVILGVCIIPILYSFFYIWAFWNPYGNLVTVPVAVVNNDQGASINGEPRNLGNEMVQKMKTGKEFKWIFVSSDSVARAGVSAGNYYTAIFIPKTFSTDIASASTTDKKTPVIQYLSNEKSNYTASKIISSAMTKIEEQTRLGVDQSITSSLTDKLRAVPASLNTLHDGLTQLSDGSNSLSTGAGSAASGASQLATGASSLTGGLQTLYNGALSLSSGAGTAANGASQLATGASSLNSGLQTLNSGAQSLSAGTSTAASGAAQVAGGAASLNNGLQTLNIGAQTLSSGVKTTASSVEKLSDALTNASSGLSQFGTNLSLYTSFTNALLFTSVSANLATIQTAANGNTTVLQSWVSTVLQGYQQKIITCLPSSDTATQSQAAIYINLYNATNIIANDTAIQNSDMTKMEQNFESVMATGATSTPSSYLFSANNLPDTLKSNAQLAAAIQSINQNNVVSSGAALTAQTSPTNDTSTLRGGIYAITSNMATLSSKMPDLITGAQQVANGTSNAASGSSTLASGSSQLASNMPALASGAQQIASGASSAAAGSSTLSSGAAQLASNMPALASGAQQIASGTSSAVSGSATLSSGASQLATGNATLASGATQLSNGLTTATQSVGNSLADANIQIKPLDGLDTYASAPLSLKSSSIYSVPNYGTGFAPYFVSISLWAGALMMIAGLQLGKGRPANPTQMRRFAMMRVAFYYIMAFMQGLTLSIFLPLSLHIQVQNMPFYILSNIVIALSFVSLILFCVTSLGIIGSFISVVLLVFQLTSSAGTFPLETTPAFFQKVSPFLPMTYSVRLLREAISGFHGNYAAYDMAFLLVLMLVLFTLIVIITHIQTTHRIAQAQMEHSDLEL